MIQEKYLYPNPKNQLYVSQLSLSSNVSQVERTISVKYKGFNDILEIKIINSLQWFQFGRKAGCYIK